MLYGADGQPVKATWLDHIIMSNPQGVMKVLSGYGYNGYLAPQGPDEMEEACADLIERHGDQAVVDLLKAHPLYDIIADLSQENTNISFRAADGSETILSTIKTINYTSLIENALIVIGAIYIADKLWKALSKDV
jgi:hypothetical protein